MRLWRRPEVLAALSRAMGRRGVRHARAHRRRKREGDDLPELPRKRAAYICSWRWKPGLGQTISRFDMTKSRASCGGMACAAMRYAQTTVAEREMPIAQCTCRGARGA